MTNKGRQYQGLLNSINLDKILKMAVETCIIPAAGKGSRWAPISGYLPKEMLPLIDKPVIDWVVEEAIDSGCTKVVIVINKQKKDIKDYLLKHSDLNKRAELVFVNQDQAQGLSQALLLCQKYVDDQPFAVALPDLPTIAHRPVLSQLVNAYEKAGSTAHIISFNTFPTDSLHFYTECLLEARKDKLLGISHFCPKDPDNLPHHPGSKIRMSGRYVFNSNIMPVIEELVGSYSGVELKEVDAIKKAMESGQQVLGLSIQGHTYDTGNPVSYIRANTAFFKKWLSKQK